MFFTIFFNASPSELRVRMRTFLASPTRATSPAPMHLYGIFIVQALQHDVAIFHLSRRWCVDMKGAAREGSTHTEVGQV